MRIMQINEASTPAPNNGEKIYLDGQETTLMGLNEARQNKQVRIVLVEGTTNQYKTLQKLVD